MTDLRADVLIASQLICTLICGYLQAIRLRAYAAYVKKPKSVLEPEWNWKTVRSFVTGFFCCWWSEKINGIRKLNNLQIVRRFSRVSCGDTASVSMETRPQTCVDNISFHARFVTLSMVNPSILFFFVSLCACNHHQHDIS